MLIKLFTHNFLFIVFFLVEWQMKEKEKKNLQTVFNLGHQASTLSPTLIEESVERSHLTLKCVRDCPKKYVQQLPSLRTWCKEMLGICSFKRKITPRKKCIHAYVSAPDVEEDGGLL